MRRSRKGSGRRERKGSIELDVSGQVVKGVKATSQTYVQATFMTDAGNASRAGTQNLQQCMCRLLLDQVITEATWNLLHHSLDRSTPTLVGGEPIRLDFYFCHFYLLIFATWAKRLLSIGGPPNKLSTRGHLDLFVMRLAVGIEPLLAFLVGRRENVLSAEDLLSLGGSSLR